MGLSPTPKTPTLRWRSPVTDDYTSLLQTGRQARGLNTLDSATTRLLAPLLGPPWIYRELLSLMARSRDSTLADREAFIFLLRSIVTTRIQCMWPAIVRTTHFPTSLWRVASRDGCSAVIRALRPRALSRLHS